MKRFLYLQLTLALVSCGARNGYFKIDGRFLNLNQGEFYVYSTDGLVNGIDTIRINGGRFTYERPCAYEGVLMLVFPNFSEQPIFATPGKAVSVKADASHLKEMTVKGTEANEEMNAFRQQAANASPPEVTRHAEEFIKVHPASPVSVYLLRKYFIADKNADLKKAETLAELLSRKQPKNGQLVKMREAIHTMKRATLNSTLPSFSAIDINGRRVSDADLRGKVSVVYVWSSWNYESQDIQRRIKRAKADAANRLGVVGINIDASKRECRNMLKYDSLQWSTVCEELMFESKLLETFGMKSIPDNLVFDANGRIVARGLRSSEMEERLKQLLK